MLLVRPDFPAKTVQDLIAYARANPGKLNYASQGIGTTSHLTAALFEKVAKVQLVHVPYKGTAPALNDIIASHVDLMFTEIATSLPLYKAGKAKNSRGCGREAHRGDPRHSDACGGRRAGLRIDTWQALTAPPQMPAAIVAKLNDAVNKAMKDPELLDRFQTTQSASGRRHARRDGRLPQGGDAKVGRRNPRGRHQAALTAGGGRGEGPCVDCRLCTRTPRTPGMTI